MLDLYLREGKWTPYVDGVREHSRRKLEWALNAAASFLPPDVKVQKPAGGLSLWLTFPEETDIAQLLRACRAKGYLFLDGAPFYIRGSGTPALRVSYGAASREDIQRAFQVLGNAYGELIET